MVFTAEQLAGGMMCLQAGTHLLRGHSGEAQTSGFFLAVMGPRAAEACGGSKWRVARADSRVCRDE